MKPMSSYFMNIENLYLHYKNSSGICTDTRKIIQDCIFFALKGENFDGNQFAEQALEQGASVVVIDNPDYYKNEQTILVKNTLKTLQQLANYHRKKLNTLVVGITGSNGKTTTKELINAVLSETFNVVATQGNLNNHIGVPLTLLNIKPSTDIAIVEMGANHPDEIAFLCSIAEPDYGYITSFGKAHLEGFGSFEGVVKAKSELYEFLKKHEKTIVENGDDTIQVDLLKSYKNKYTFNAKTEDNNLNISVISNHPIAVSFNQLEINTNLTGIYNLSNISAAIAFGRLFKLSPETIKRGIEKYVPNNNRSQVVQKNTNTIVLDAYNANPNSMLVAINNLLTFENTKKTLFLGDMFELGKTALKEHQKIVDEISEHSWENVYLIGKQFHQTKNNFRSFESFDSFQAYFSKQPEIKNNVILIKGSRGMAMERIMTII